MRLTDHFTLEEFVTSNVAARRGIDNTPTAEAMVNIQTLLAPGMEALRRALGQPIIVSSGYRSPELNSAVGGSLNSAHMRGLAADFICPRYGTPFEVCCHIAELNVPYDQLIYEFNSWIHVSFAPSNRMMNLTINRSGVFQGILA